MLQCLGVRMDVKDLSEITLNLIEILAQNVLALTINLEYTNWNITL